MKFLYACVALVVTALTLSSAAARAQSVVSEDKWVGPVHTVLVEFAELATVNGKEVEINRRSHQKIVYDRRGNEIERINFKPDGSIENRAVQLIDADGHIRGWEEYETEADGKKERLTGRSEWIYDEKGNRVEVRVYNNAELTQRTTASYDLAGHVLEEMMATDNGTWKVTKKHDYDVGGRLTRTLVDTNGRIELIDQGYDDSDNLMSYKSSSSDGQNGSTTRYAYDASGREIERIGEDALTKSQLITSYDSQGRVSRRVTRFEYKRPNMFMSHAPEPGTVEFRYQADNQVVEERVYSPEGTLKRRTINSYDQNGKMQSQVYYNGADTVAGKVSYEYDKWGNRVKTVTVSSDQNRKPVIHISRHRITYYTER
jgi:YD repeat-containing protein